MKKLLTWIRQRFCSHIEAKSIDIAASCLCEFEAGEIVCHDKNRIHDKCGKKLPEYLPIITPMKKLIETLQEDNQEKK